MASDYILYTMTCNQYPLLSMSFTGFLFWVTFDGLQIVPKVSGPNVTYDVNPLTCESK